MILIIQESMSKEAIKSVQQHVIDTGQPIPQYHTKGLINTNERELSHRQHQNLESSTQALHT